MMKKKLVLIAGDQYQLNRAGSMLAYQLKSYWIISYFEFRAIV